MTPLECQIPFALRHVAYFREVARPLHFRRAAETLAVAEPAMRPSEARRLPDEVTFRPLSGPAPESRLVVGWKQTESLDPALAAFVALATETPRRTGLSARSLPPTGARPR